DRNGSSRALAWSPCRHQCFRCKTLLQRRPDLGSVQQCTIQCIRQLTPWVLTGFWICTTLAHRPHIAFEAHAGRDLGQPAGECVVGGSVYHFFPIRRFSNDMGTLPPYTAKDTIPLYVVHLL